MRKRTCYFFLLETSAVNLKFRQRNFIINEGVREETSEDANQTVQVRNCWVIIIIYNYKQVPKKKSL